MPHAPVGRTDDTHFYSPLRRCVGGQKGGRPPAPLWIRLLVDIFFGCYRGTKGMPYIIFTKFIINHVSVINKLHI